MLTFPVRRFGVLVRLVHHSGQRQINQAARLAARNGGRAENVLVEEASKGVINKKIYVLHDLDNKQPRQLPAEQLVHNIRQALEPKFGAIQSFKVRGCCLFGKCAILLTSLQAQAYGNRHTFEWVFPYEKRQRALKAR